MFGLKGMLAMGAVMALMTVGFGWYYKATQARMEAFIANEATYKANEITLKTEIEGQNESIRKLDERRTLDQETILRISDEFNESREQVAKLRQTFSRHDLAHLSIKKPGLIEKVINKGTAAVGRDIVEMTNPRREELPTEPEVETNE